MRSTYLQQYEKELIETAFGGVAESGRLEGMWRFISPLLESMSIEEISNQFHIAPTEIQQVIDYNSGK